MSLLSETIQKMDDKLHDRTALPPGDYEALRNEYNELAQLAEDVVLIHNREGA